jgi:hypothetical protein
MTQPKPVAKPTADRGRPRIHPLNVSPAELAADWTAQHRKAGGKSIRVNLTPLAAKALEALAGPRKRSGLIGRLLVAEYRRQQATK